MQLSAELRWFWSERQPDGLEAWFLDQQVHGCAAGGGSVRVDIYLHDTEQIELGVKRRGSKPGLEVKGLIATLREPISFAGNEMEPEIWCKWPSRTLTIDPASSVTLPKRRWLRKFDTSDARPIEVPLNETELPFGGGPLPKIGCNVEWTVIDAPSGGIVWTMGFESFGSLQNIEASLRSVVAALEQRKPPECSNAIRGGYPAWIAQLHCPTSSGRDAA